MLQNKKTNLEKNTFQFDVDVAWSKIQDKYNTAFDEIAAGTQIEGFRRGKAPKDVLLKHINKDDVYKKLVQLLIPEIYAELVKQEDLKPLVPPQVSLLKAKENEDWSLRFLVAEKPIVDLMDYKSEVKNAILEEKKSDIWVPGKDKQKESDAQKKEQQSRLLNKILETLLIKTKVEISNLIIEQELNKKLSQLLDDVNKIGLTVESYLESKKETIDSIKNKFKKEIEDTYKLEFIFEAIAEEAKLTVEKADIDALITQTKDEASRQQIEQNSYFYASILRRQKTIDYLLSL